MKTNGKTAAAVLVGSLLASGLVLGAAAPAQAATRTYTVNDLGDAQDGAWGDGTCATTGGVCTFRAAIEEANTHPADVNRIHFSVAGTIQASEAMPNYNDVESDGTIIDGTTAPGWAAGAPTVTIRGRAINPGATGLQVEGDDVTIKGVRLAKWGRAIELQGDGGIIQGNQIGTGGGAFDANLEVGVGIYALAADATIGGPAAGQGNLIAGFYAKAINTGPGSTGLVIEGNRVGTNAAGTASAAHPDGTRIIEFENSTTINVALDLSGATNAMVRNNLISGNPGYGIGVKNGSATIIGNRIGTTADGTAALPNTGVGVAAQLATNLTIGGTGPGEGNVIAGTAAPLIVNFERGSGILIEQGATATIRGNRIGTNATGTAVLSNKNVGITLEDNGSSATIGGTAAGAGNQIAGTGGSGILVNGTTAANQVEATIQGNQISTDPTGASKLGTLAVGIAVGCGGKVQVGGTTAAAGNLINANVTGLGICDAGRGSTIQGNRIGTNAAGSVSFPANYGIQVDKPDTGGATVGATRLQVGGTAAGAGNQIAGATSDGIYAKGPVDILGNRIGTNAAGTAALTNGYLGIEVARQGVVVGGSAPGAGNLIGGWDGYGVLISNSSNTVTGTVVKGNRIGVDAVGTGSIPNRIGIGVQMVNGTIIGGPAPGEGNVVANSTWDGIVNFAPVSEVSMRGNLIYANGEQSIENANFQWGDGGSNKDQMPPIMTATLGAQTGVTGTLKTDKAGPVTVDVYASNTCGPDGQGEAKQFLGTISFDHPGGGAAQAFSGNVPAPTAGLDQITGIATVPGNGSSQLSPCIPISDLQVYAVANATKAPVGDEVATLVTITNRGPSPATGLVADLKVGIGPQAAADGYVADVPSKGTVDTAAKTWNIGTLASGASATVCLRATIVRAEYEYQPGTNFSAITYGGASTQTWAPDPYTGNDIYEAVVQVGPRTASATPNACPLPTFSIGDAQVTRPMSGTATMSFPVTLSSVQTRAVTVQYATQNGTAAGVIDFTPTTGTLTIPAGQTTGTIQVPIVGNQSDEPDKAFTVVLSAPSKATVADGTATGTIKANGALAGCPQTPTSNEAFVCHLYFDALNRKAETGGFNYWVKRLNNGDPRANMAKTYMAQAESRRVLVDRVFVFYLGRRGTATELKSWADKLAAKTTTPEKIRISLLASNEYYARAGSTGEAWVVRVYKDVFRRDPDPGGKQYWLNKLNAGQTRTQVATGMLITSEGRRRVIDDIFLRFLRRYPPQSESTPWVNQLNAGKTEIDVMVSVIASAEYFTRP